MKISSSQAASNSTDRFTLYQRARKNFDLFYSQKKFDGLTDKGGRGGGDLRPPPLWGAGNKIHRVSPIARVMSVAFC